MNRIIQKRIEKLEGVVGKPSDLANLSDDELAATLEAARNGSIDDARRLRPSAGRV